jgi:hypothetical protein
LPTITIDEQQFRRRGQSVRTLLTAISRVPGGPAFQHVSAQGGARIIATYDGTRPSSTYRDWRFETKIRGYSALYFEEWLPLSGARPFWLLAKAYLDIFRSICRDREEEFFALHCDPEEPYGKAPYKRGPHFHVMCAVDPVPRAHLALGSEHLSEILTDLQSLTKSLRHGMELLQVEVLDRIAVNPPA